MHMYAYIHIYNTNTLCTLACVCSSTTVQLRMYAYMVTIHTSVYKHMMSVCMNTYTRMSDMYVHILYTNNSCSDLMQKDSEYTNFCKESEYEGIRVVFPCLSCKLKLPAYPNIQKKVQQRTWALDASKKKTDTEPES